MLLDHFVSNAGKVMCQNETIESTLRNLEKDFVSQKFCQPSYDQYFFYGETRYLICSSKIYEK